MSLGRKSKTIVRRWLRSPMSEEMITEIEEALLTIESPDFASRDVAMLVAKVRQLERNCERFRRLLIARAKK